MLVRWAVLAALLMVTPAAWADEGEDALALARSTVEKHRSDDHRERFQVVYPPPRAAPAKGEASLEDRSGVYATVETERFLSLDEQGGLLLVVSRKHIPTFAARATGNRDRATLLECRLPLARARTTLLALDLLARAVERPRAQGPTKPLPPEREVREDPEGEGGSDEGARFPRLALVLDGRPSTRRGPYAQLGRMLLDDVAREGGLAEPRDPATSLGRLVAWLQRGDDRAPCAAFVLGDAGFADALPALAKLDFEEARDARAKLEALAKGETGLLQLSSRSPSWDVRAWARERLEAKSKTRAAWVEAALGDGSALESALVEALRSVEPPYPEALRARVERFLDDARASVRVAAAGLLVRWSSLKRARDLLVKTARDESAESDVREDAAAQLASSLLPSDLAGTLGPLVADDGVPPTVRAVAVRSLDAAQAVPAASVLASTLERELGRAERIDRSKDPSGGDACRDLRAALVAALATTACVGSDARGEPEEASTAALALASLAEPEDELRAAAIHAVGALPGERAKRAVASALEAEDGRKPISPRALRAAEIETDARRAGKERLLAIADATCDAPTRSTLERLAIAARDGISRNVLLERLRQRGPDGEIGLEVLGRTR